MCPLLIRIAIILFISSFCDGAVLMRTSSETKSLQDASPKYIISSNENVSSDVCVIKSDTTSNQFNVHINCTDVRGDVFPLDLTADKFLHLRNSNRYIAPGKYCVTKRKFAKLCPSSSSSQFTWRKCCPQNRLVNLTSANSCIASSNPFRLSVNHDNPSFYVANTNKVGLTCPVGYSLKTFSTHPCAAQSMTRFQLSPATGTIQYEISTGVFLRKSEWRTVNPSSNLYCLDGVANPVSNCNNDASRRFQQKQQQRLVGYGEINKSGSWPIKWDDDSRSSSGSSLSSFYSNCGGKTGDDGESADRQRQKIASILFVCVQNVDISPEPLNENISSKTTLLAVIWLSTCPLLLGAALGNACIIQKNVHGWILTCYLSSMCILNVLSAVVILKVGRQEDEKGCQPIDFVIKFFYMSTLCWMSSINFGLHKTFRYTLPHPVGCRRFITSVIFSLGFPAISVTVAYYAALLSIDRTCGGLGYCILFNPVTIPFYSVPMLLLVLGNFAIFLKTSYTIAMLRKEAEDVLQRQAEDHLKSFSLFAKLFLLTGCIWLLRLALFVLQVKGLYLSWYGVMLETVFSIPEVVFPMIVFHHPEFIKWSWSKVPMVSNFIFKFNPLFNAPAPK